MAFLTLVANEDAESDQFEAKLAQVRAGDGKDAMLPAVVVSKLVPIRKVTASVSNIGEGACDGETMAQSFASWASFREPLEALLQACSSSCQGMDAAKKAKTREAEASQRKASQKAKAEAKAKAKGGHSKTTSGRPSEPSLHKIFDADLSSHAEIPVAADMRGVKQPCAPFHHQAWLG